MTALVTFHLRAQPRRLTAAFSGERAVVLIASAAVGVHIVDDNLLQPQPGMSARDHLAGGLVQLALAAIAGIGVASGRLRSGARATLALLLGFLGALGGSEAVYYTAAGGMSGDDYTGLLSLVGGVVLLCVGVGVLWRTRRTNDRASWRYLRRGLVGVGALATTALALFPAAVAYVVTHTLRSGVPVAHLGATPEDVSFMTSDGLRLEGWFVPSRNGATVIASPGRSGPQKQARMLVRHGYGVLLFDRRGEGASEGDPNVFGWVGDRDLHAAVAFLRTRKDVHADRIGGIGFSVGGEMLIHAAAHTHSFRAIVTEGASSQSFRDGRANNGTLSAVLGDGPVTLATAIFSSTLPPPSLKSEVPRISPTAAFFVYGEKGQNGSEVQPNKNFYAAAGKPKAIWEVRGGQHIAGITTRPREYERRVVAFFDRTLLDK